MRICKSIRVVVILTLNNMSQILYLNIVIFLFYGTFEKNQHFLEGLTEA